MSDLPQTKPPFEKTAAYLSEMQMHTSDIASHGNFLRVQLSERGRDVLVSPEDDDLMRWYNECLEDLAEDHQRRLEDLKVAYDRGEL